MSNASAAMEQPVARHGLGFRVLIEFLILVYEYNYLLL